MIVNVGVVITLGGEMKSELVKYAKGMGCSATVIEWLGRCVTASHDQAEVEHIIDYLVSDKSPTRLERATYEQMKKGAEKWVASLQKKGLHIKEQPEDVEVVKKWSSGFRMVKLVGKRAYEREGHLMRHCVASYFGKNDEIYSLRDKDNMPHATLSRSSQQIKGKGNGSIHPKYVNYVVEFLEHLKIEVRDSEMSNLGYVNIDSIDDKEAVFPKACLFRDKYFFKDHLEQIVDKEGNRYENITLWNAFGLFEIDANMKVKFNFSISKCIERFRGMFKKGKDVQAAGHYAQQAAEDNAQQAAEDDAQQAAGYNAQQAAEDNAQQAAGYYAKQAAGHYAKQAAEDDAQQAAGNCAKQAAGNNAQQAAGYYAKQAAGDNAQQAAGYNAQQAAGDCAQQAAGNCAKQESGAYSMMVAGIESAQTMKGVNSLALSGKNSKARGVKGAWIILTEWDDDGNIVGVHPRKVDGNEIKEMVFYTLKEGKFVEAE